MSFKVIHSYTNMDTDIHKGRVMNMQTNTVIHASRMLSYDIFSTEFPICAYQQCALDRTSDCQCHHASYYMNVSRVYRLLLCLLILHWCQDWDLLPEILPLEVHSKQTLQ